MIKVIIFDLDDTLYYEKQFVLCGFKNVCIYLSKKYNKDLNKLYKDTIDILDKDGRGKIFDFLCKKNNFKEDINDLVLIYRNTKPTLTLYEDSIKIFKYLKNNNIKTGIITDGCALVQWNKIKSLKIDKKVDKVIVTDDYDGNFSKPSTKSYLEMAEYFKVNPKECIYIGDNPKKDFIGAKSIGMKTVRIIREKGDHVSDIEDNKHEADKKIKNLEEIKDIIKL
ncbi:HAD-IA family hydrolase [Clostridium sp. BJN0001]|uniref:HAD family hydrolase n=1 Tax=Clostridium sp. BJN0001 TaxID=2930219 RepID=UPI001FD5B5A0|nr:HAD-IA family hydrolase [Clostridium sp. BJN0001]